MKKITLPDDCHADLIGRFTAERDQLENHLALIERCRKHGFDTRWDHGTRIDNAHREKVYPLRIAQLTKLIAALEDAETI
jgi:hypothetical protein